MIKFLDLKGITDKYSKEIHEAVKSVIDSGWYLQHYENRMFEENYAKYIGTNCCIGVGNGLDALFLIYRSYIELGLMKRGDEVIVPANTYIASILAITENGLKPVLVEPSIDTLEIDEAKIENLITERTKSIMIVHLYGRCAYTNLIGTLCEKYNLLLVEDNAQAHGCKFNDIRTGAIGDAAAHSFYPGKNLGALGDAGAVTTNNKDVADCIRIIANYGSQEKYVFKYKGRNSRLDEIQAAVLNVKLKYLDEDNAHRQLIANYYYENIDNSCITIPKYVNDSSNVYHVFPVLCNKRDNLQKYLLQNGVQTLIHYPIPPHKQECYKEWCNISLPITEHIHKQELSIPISPIMNMREVIKVTDLINKFK